ncbi:MAG: CocE/NonD family hydrolase [Pseudomonadota bacterium]
MVTACSDDPATPASSTAAEKQSSFGVYQGYSQPAFDGFERQSLYVPARDGTSIAMDLFFPTKEGRRADGPLPVAFVYSGYRRVSFAKDGGLYTKAGYLAEGENSAPLPDDGEVHYGHVAHELLRHGYIVAAASSRGTGASFGKFSGHGSGIQRRDGYDLVEWLASQPFSDGQVGMFGGSYYGQTLLAVMSEAPPSLKAAFPDVAQFDAYQIWWSGTGVIRKAGVSWTVSEARAGGRLQDEGTNRLVQRIVPVDDDQDGALLAEALEERRQGAFGIDPVAQMLTAAPQTAAALMRAAPTLGVTSAAEFVALLMDAERLNAVLSQNPELSAVLAQLKYPREMVASLEPKETGDNNLASLLTLINESNIPVYHWGGWRDGYPQSTLHWFANSTSEAKVAIGPWTHGGASDPRDKESLRLRAIELRRWFDRWLKGIDNGVTEEAPVHFAVAENADTDEKASAEFDGFRWQSAMKWPPADTERMEFALSSEGAETISSVYDGALQRDAQVEASSAAFLVDYTATTGTKTRYYDTAVGGPLLYPDLNEHAQTAVTFTSSPFEEDAKLIGFPVVDVHVSSTAADGIFHFYLEEVTSDGKAHFLSEGTMRASHAKLGTPPYDNFGLPWSASDAASIKQAASLVDEPVKLSLALQPIGALIETGSRVRLVITGADADDALTIPLYPKPTHTIHFGGERRSTLSLRFKPQD